MDPSIIEVKSLESGDFWQKNRTPQKKLEALLLEIGKLFCHFCSKLRGFTRRHTLATSHGETFSNSCHISRKTKDYQPAC